MIASGRVMVNGQPPRTGQDIDATDQITIDGRLIPIASNLQSITLVLNKPVGFVCSRNGQGNRTIYDLLPPKLHGLKPVGRLDKDSSGLLLLTSDGKLAFELTHPSFLKPKVYQVRLDRPLEAKHLLELKSGVELEDGLSRLDVRPNGQGPDYEVRMSEGRNRQVRRTFSSLGYRVKKLNRSEFGDFSLGNLAVGSYKQL